MNPFIGQWKSSKALRPEISLSALALTSPEFGDPTLDGGTAPVQTPRVVPSISLREAAEVAWGIEPDRGSPTQRTNKTPVLDWPVGKTVPFSDRNASQLIAEWHGQVLSIDEENFVAELRGTLGAGVAREHEEALIPIAEIRRDDMELFMIGAFFRLCVSYEIAPSGNRRRYTELIFRRVPAYRQDEIQAARDRAREISRALRVE